MRLAPAADAIGWPVRDALGKHVAGWCSRCGSASGGPIYSPDRGSPKMKSSIITTSRFVSSSSDGSALPLVIRT